MTEDTHPLKPLRLWSRAAASAVAALLSFLPALSLAGSIYAPAPTAAGVGAQPVDATLTALSGASCAADTVLYCDGADSVAAGTLTAAGRAIIDDATAGDQRTTLGLGALCTGADSGDVPYTPNTGTDWTDPDPVDAADALDTLAGRVVALESAPAASDAADVTYTPGSLLDWAGSADPGDTDVALDQLADRTAALEGAGAGVLGDGTGITDASAFRTALGVDASGTSPYAADSWDYSWVAADGDPLATGWANAGTQAMTTASTTYLGVPCWSLAASGSSGTSYVKVASGVAAAGSFELRAKIAMVGSFGSTVRFPLGYNPNATEFGSKSLQLAITTAYLAFWNGTNISIIEQIGNQIGIWATITIRAYHSTGANGFAEWVFQPWIGGVALPLFNVSGGDATLGAAGDIFLGRLNAGTNAGTFYLAEMKLKNGINAAPPSYTLRGNTWPL